MHVNYRNVNSALPDLVDIVVKQGTRMGSRNGEVISLTSPITVTTVNPWERVCLNPERRSNPFLFLLDGLSILSNNDMVAPLASIVPRMADFSDDGVYLRGHYGKRLYDLIPTAINMLSRDEYTRRCVMSIWDNDCDLDTVSKDIPCNLMVIPRVVERSRNGVIAKQLDLTVVNRSNDLFWGMMGANVVQFSFLLEFMAKALDIQMGHLSQMTTNLHFYTGFGPGKRVVVADQGAGSSHPFYFTPDEYPLHIPIDFGDVGFRNFQYDVEALMLWMAGHRQKPPSTRSDFLTGVAIPMMQAWKAQSLEPLEGWPVCDWFVAAERYFTKGE